MLIIGWVITLFSALMLIVSILPVFYTFDYDPLDYGSGNIEARCPGTIYLHYYVDEAIWGEPEVEYLIVDYGVDGPYEVEEMDKGMSIFEKRFEVSKKGTYNIWVSTNDGYYEVYGFAIFIGKATIPFSCCSCCTVPVLLIMGIILMTVGHAKREKESEE